MVLCLVCSTETGNYGALIGDNSRSKENWKESFQLALFCCKKEWKTHGSICRTCQKKVQNIVTAVEEFKNSFPIDNSTFNISTPSDDSYSYIPFKFSPISGSNYFPSNYYSSTSDPSSYYSSNYFPSNYHFSTFDPSTHYTYNPSYSTPIRSKGPIHFNVENQSTETQQKQKQKQKQKEKQKEKEPFRVLFLLLIFHLIPHFRNG